MLSLFVHQKDGTQYPREDGFIAEDEFRHDALQWHVGRQHLEQAALCGILLLELVLLGDVYGGAHNKCRLPDSIKQRHQRCQGMAGIFLPLPRTTSSSVSALPELNASMSRSWK